MVSAVPTGGLADTATAAIAVLRADGQFVRNDPSVLPIYSLTKTFIAAAVVRLGVDLQTPVSNWFSSALLPAADRITVAMLLNHTSGIRDYFPPPSPYAETVRSGAPPWSDEVFARHTLNQPLLFEPGTQFSYSNPGYFLLGQLLEQLTGQSLADVIGEQIAVPLGLTSLRMAQGQFAEDLPDYPAEWVWHGLLLASPGDVARFMASPLIDPLATTLTPVPGAQPPWRAPHYGYGLMCEPGECVGHNGEGPGYSASCMRFSDATLCVLQPIQTPAASPDQALQRLRRLRAAGG